ncbi:MAG: phosphotransferase [Clostridiales bacterium]|nr:phosphotransferase [Clostridiales bacterium]
MFYQVEQVLEKQQAKTEKFYKGRGILICETAEGLFALKEFHGQEQKAANLFLLGEFLTEHHISCDSMVKNSEDALITEGVDGAKYTFHHWFRGKECDVRNRMDLVMAVSFLAGYHAVCEGRRFCGRQEERSCGDGSFCGKNPEKPCEEKGICDSRPETVYEEYLRHERELRRIRKYILKRKNKSDFERLYLKSFPEYLRQSDRVLRMLSERQDIFDIHTAGMCHGDFNQHNIVKDAGGMALIHMEHSRYGAQVTDLGNFLRKSLEKHDWSETLGLEMLREYDRVHVLNEADWMELYCRMCYPEKFWKIANHYYNSSKVWNSGNYFEKLRRELRQNASRQRFLEALRRARVGMVDS